MRDIKEFNINIYEMGVDGSRTERKINKTNSSKTLDISDFKNKKIDMNSEGYIKLTKRAQEFYFNQNQEIDGFDEVETILNSATRIEDAQIALDHLKKQEKIVIWLSFGVNCLLIISLILAVAFSGSIAIIASLIDSSLDLLSSVIMIVTNRAKNKVNRYKYPQGRERLEPVGILIFSAVMGTASLLLIIESAQRLIFNTFDSPDVGWITIGLVIADIAIKFCLYLYCRRLSSRLPTAKAFAQDHRNDVVVNSFALASAYMGSALWAPVDPMGAILISLWTMYNWGDSCLEQVKLLTGRSASPEFLKRLTWVCYNHDPTILGIDTVRAFHFGTRFLVEIDIVLPPKLTLQKAHDIGEALQKKVELLEEVERAFVHLDFETSHNPNSEHKQWGRD